jgi:D-glycero-D-manno-heptose 1,7-bisphosphate phosphatase
MNKALFIDRDGVINVDKVHVSRKEDFEFTEGIFDLCRKYASEGYLIIVITNQAGIAKGLYSDKDFDKLSDWMTRQFDEILQAIKDFDLDISKSVLIGDMESDLEAGRRAGIPESNLHNYLKSL